MLSLHVLTLTCPISFSVVEISSHLATTIFSTFSFETEECLLLEADPRLGKTRLRRGSDDGAPLSFPLLQVVFLFCDCDGFITGWSATGWDLWSEFVTEGLTTVVHLELACSLLSFREGDFEISSVVESGGRSNLNNYHTYRQARSRVPPKVHLMRLSLAG